jgi:hypothetical protein
MAGIFKSYNQLNSSVFVFSFMGVFPAAVAMEIVCDSA